MKKSIITGLVAMFMLPFGANAEEVKNEEKKTYTFLELQPIVGDLDAINIQGGIMYKANEYLSFGGGLGILEPFKFNVAPTLPLFVRAQAEKKLEGVTPFISFDAGFAFCTENFDYSCVILNPMAGVQFGNIYAGIGYYGQIPTKGSGVGSSVNFRVGYKFGAGKMPDLSKAIKKTYFTVEVGGGVGLQSVSAQDFYRGAGYDDKVTLGNNFTAQLTYMIQFGDHWGVGVGTGFRGHVQSYSTDSFEDTELGTTIPLYVRGQYTFFNEGRLIRPYIACDLGGLIDISGNVTYAYKGFLIEPQIGVKFKDKYSLSVGIAAYNAEPEYYYSSYDLDSKSCASLNFKIGMDF